MSTRPTFSVSAGEPDAIDLELAELGAVPDPVARERIARAADGALRPVADSVAEYRAWFGRTARPLPRSAARRSWPIAVAGLAAAAAVLAVAVLPGADGPGARAMGGLPVDVRVRHAGAAAGPPDGAWRPGDELAVRFVAPAAGTVTVATVEADGDVSVLDPGTPVPAGGTYVLPGAARLDGQPGREWLVVRLGEQAADEPALRALLPDPGAAASPDRVWVLELTRTP